jgi:hypothetical protein
MRTSSGFPCLLASRSTRHRAAGDGRRTSSADPRLANRLANAVCWCCASHPAKQSWTRAGSPNTEASCVHAKHGILPFSLGKRSLLVLRFASCEAVLDEGGLPEHRSELCSRETWHPAIFAWQTQFAGAALRILRSSLGRGRAPRTPKRASGASAQHAHHHPNRNRRAAERAKRVRGARPVPGAPPGTVIGKFTEKSTPDATGHLSCIFEGGLTGRRRTSPIPHQRSSPPWPQPPAPAPPKPS